MPTPASTISGTSVIISRRMRMLGWFWMPSPLPIGAPSGITALAPASIKRFATTMSSEVYGKTVKPSFTSTRVASIVACTSGNSVAWSPMTSIFTQSDRPTSRPSRAVRMASSAV